MSQPPAEKTQPAQGKQKKQKKQKRPWTKHETVLVGATFVLAVVGAWLANRSESDIAQAVFTAAVAVVVFLLPAAALIGPYLANEAKDAVSFASEKNCPPTERAEIAEELKQLIERALLQRRVGLPCTMIATALSATATVGTGVTFHTLYECVHLDRLLAGAAVGCLLGTAISIWPMTTSLFELGSAQGLYDRIVAAAQGAGEVQTNTGSGQDGPGNPAQSTSPQGGQADDSDGGQDARGQE